jgi:ATP-dependent exoDNAse (exonuclease V) beta subunit
MMSSVSKVLKDDGARRDAISLHDRSILVEAGAGSGKTAVMAGRIAAMLAEGVAPRSIAAVTFTELAASELLSRVREFVADLSAGTIATELRVALPDGCPRPIATISPPPAPRSTKSPARPSTASASA